jgi:hypothetical protein
LAQGSRVPARKEGKCCSRLRWATVTHKHLKLESWLMPVKDTVIGKMYNILPLLFLERALQRHVGECYENSWNRS